MAKLLYLAAFLAACQYAAAGTDHMTMAAAIIEQHAPAALTDAMNSIQGVIDRMPSADQVDQMVGDAMAAVDQIVEQMRPAKEIVQAIKDFGPLFVRNVFDAVVAAIRTSVAQNMQSPQAVQIGAQVTNVMSGFDKGVRRATAVAEEATNHVQNMMGVQANGV